MANTDGTKRAKTDAKGYKNSFSYTDLYDTIKLPIIKNLENDTVEIPILKGSIESTIEIPVLRSAESESIKLPILRVLESANSPLPKFKGFESDTLEIPRKEETSAKIELPVLKKYRDGSIEISKMAELEKETMTISMSKIQEDGTIELPIFKSSNNGLIEVPIFEGCHSDDESPKLSYILPDTVILPKIKSDLVSKYKTKISNLENTSIFNLSTLKTISFPSNLDDFIEKYDISDLIRPLKSEDIDTIDKSVLIKLPSIGKKNFYIQMEKFFYRTVLAISVLGIFIVGFQIMSSIKSYYATQKEIERVQSIANSVPEFNIISDNLEIQIDDISFEDDDETYEVKDDKSNIYNIYSSYTKDSINFQDLYAINGDTEGWLIVQGTDINYPIVRAEDNDFYLNHSFDQSYNISGWVFMDYRNRAKKLSQNTIIYAHNTKNRTMFGTLKNLLSSSDEHIVELITPDYKSVWKVFSVYTIPATSDYLTTAFSTKSEYREFLDLIIGRSKFDYATPVDTEDKILTLSTCHNHYSRTVVHAKLIDMS